jgi:uncharacterized protein YecE (DUF72 family)
MERWTVQNLSLFDEPSNFDRVKLATRLRALAEKGIYVGGSSWKYEGWLGQIYTQERYYTRGRFSRKRFEETCLAEYAETFPVVCGDFSFYQFPTDAFWRKLFAGTPPSLRFGLKVPEDITVKTFPTHARYGPRAGLDNPSFLNADLFEMAFVELLRPHRERLSFLIFEFGTFSRQCYRDATEFDEDLDRFLVRLPPGRFGTSISSPRNISAYFAKTRHRSRLQCLDSHAGDSDSAWDGGSIHNELCGLSRATAKRASV